MGYWESRQHYEYYSVVRRWLDELGERESILDIGPMDTSVATWGQFGRRYTLGPRARPELPGVDAIIGKWPDDWGTIWGRMSVVTCLQVLEHVADPSAFARSLFDSASMSVILSVPWQWPAGAEPYHKHDPIDGAKLLDWTGRQPDRIHVTAAPARRSVVFYDLTPQNRHPIAK